MDAQPLTLPEIKIKKAELAKEITRLVRSFEDLVGSPVDIDIFRGEMSNGNSFTIYCEVTVRI